MNQSISPINRKALLLVSALALGLPVSAQAIDLCGQTITKDTKLDQDLTCGSSISVGIAIGADNITLDCDDHTLTLRRAPIVRGPPNPNGISLFERQGVTVKNCNVVTAGTGILLLNSSRNKIIRNNVTNTDFGIVLSLSSHNKLIGNTANGNFLGIGLQGSNDNKLVENTTNDQIQQHPAVTAITPPILGMGISLVESSGNRLIDNTASNNQSEGIILRQSSNSNRLTDNTANDNGTDGIEVEDSSRNRLRDNTANNNGKAGGKESSGNPAAGFSIESSARNRLTDNDAEGNAQFDALQQGGADNVFRDNDFGTSSGI